MNIKQVETADDKECVRALSDEYLRWVFTELNAEFNTGWDVNDATSLVDEWMPELDTFKPPDGQFLLLQNDGQSVGMGGLHKLSDSICEIKRMYVRPAYRGQGIGRVILNALLKTAREQAFTIVCLDSPKIARTAHALYRSAGFYDIEPYAESEGGTDAVPYLIYMEMKLD